GIGNPLTPEKVELGKMLFFETGLGQDAVREDGKETFSCASCHIPSSGFMPGRVQGIADGGLGFGYKGEARYVDTDYREEELDVQGARPLSLLNVAYVTNSTWSGKFGAHGVNKGTEFAWDNEEATKINYMGLDGLESQNIEGLALHRMVVNEEVLRKYGYLPMFDEAFPDMPEDQRYSPIAASFAISAYLRTLLPNEAPFQRWLKGEEEALTDQEKLGAILFFGKAGCYRCHKEPGLNSMEFHAVGVRDLYEAGGLATGINDNRNLGRGGFTGRAEDMYKFKVPQLYNMGDSPFYFHGSSKRSLEDVVRYFNDAIPENERVPDEQISPFFTPLNLTDQEIDNITAFLENGLRDPNLERYQPDFVLSGNCFPNNDPVSRSHLGCY
ncbi:MAG: cytochrome c peroxidase, partial [Saprospiraceae bacterium]|nr:cytochrome c peroxidase [Saprospiraceae bacterium]